MSESSKSDESDIAALGEVMDRLRALLRVGKSSTRLRPRRISLRRPSTEADRQDLLVLVEAGRILAGMDRFKRQSTPAAVETAAADHDRLDDLERQLLVKSRALETLTLRHEAVVRRQDLLGTRYAAEVDRLREQLDALRQGPDRLLGLRQRAEVHHQRFARQRSHPLVDDAMEFTNATPQWPESSMDAPLFTRTNFQPTLKLNPDGTYDVTDFLALHDRNFVRAAYLAILRREPDPEGAENYVGQVRAGEPKARLLKEFLLSEEGRRHRTEIRGLDAHLRVLRLCDLPLVGRLIAALLFLANINGHLRDLRVLENHVIRIAEESQATHETNLSKLRSISK